MEPPEASRPPTGGDLDVLVDELVDRFRLGDRPGAIARTRALLRSGVSARTVRTVVCHAQDHVGRLWQQGRWTITQEHQATAVADAVLATVDDVVVATDGGPATLGPVAVVGADGEWHALAARLAAQACQEAGLGVTLLGASVPADDLDRTLPALDVRALAVSVTLASNLVGAAATVAAGRTAEIPVLLGGQASSPRRAAALGATAHADDVDVGAQLLRRWLEEGAPAAPSPRVHPEVADRLRVRRTAVLDAAYTTAEGRCPELAIAPERTIDRAIEDLGLLFDHTVAAVLVDEDAVLLDQVPWLAEVHQGRGLPDSLLTGQLAGLAGALTDQPRVHALLQAALEAR